MTIDLSMINPGDDVTVEVTDGGHAATLSGKAWEWNGGLMLGPYLIRYSSGRTRPTVTRLVSHTPALPDWVTDDDVVVVKDRHGDLWTRFRDGTWGGFTSAELHARYGPCTVYARRADR